MVDSRSISASVDALCQDPESESCCCEEMSKGIEERLLIEKKQEIRRAILEIFAKDEIQDLLEKQCVSNELLKVWEEREATYMKVYSHDALEVPSEVRGVVVWYMAHLVEHLGLPESAWFAAVTLFDTYCVRMSELCPQGIQVRDMPMLTGVLVALIKKADKANRLVFQEGAVLEAVVKQLAAWLQQRGYEVKCDWAEARVKEEAVLTVMNWQINLPTVDPWMSAFCARISAVTPQAVMPTLKWIWQQGLYLARNILLRHAITKDFSPQHIAQGLLALGFLTGKLLPLETFDMTELSAPEWNWLFLPVQGDQAIPNNTNGKQESPTSQGPRGNDRHHLFLIELLQVATGADTATLKKDCRQVFKSIAALKRSHEVQVHHTSL